MAGTWRELLNATLQAKISDPGTAFAGLLAAHFEVVDAVADHEAAVNPHPGYLTQAEGDALYSPLVTLAAGTYTPTLVNVANLDASGALQCQYLRIGATVHVSGKVTVDPTTPATLTQLGVSLPVASNIGAEEDCAGAAFASGIAGQGAAIRGDAANNRAEMAWIAGDVTNQPMYFSFSYQVI